MAEKNSLWRNIRKKAEQNRRTGATPKKPTKEMLRQERKIRAKKYAEGGPTKSLVQPPVLLDDNIIYPTDNPYMPGVNKDILDAEYRKYNQWRNTFINKEGMTPEEYYEMYPTKEDYDKKNFDINKTYGEQAATGGYMYATGGTIIDPRGQWAHPGKRTIVPSPTGEITMQGVPYPVYGEDETGYGQIMYPNNEYQFPGQMIDETPMKMQVGGPTPARPTIWDPKKAWWGGRERNSERSIDLPGVGIDNGKLDPTTRWALDNWDILPLDKKNELINLSKKDVGTRFENFLNDAANPALFLISAAGTAYGYQKVRENPHIIENIKKFPRRIYNRFSDSIHGSKDITFDNGGFIYQNQPIDDEKQKLINWYNHPETKYRLVNQFKKATHDLPVKDLLFNKGPKDLNERRIQRTEESLENALSGLEETIRNAPIMLNPTQDEFNEYKYSQPLKYQKEIDKTLKKHPQAFTGPDGTIVILNPNEQLLNYKTDSLQNQNKPDMSKYLEYDDFEKKVHELIHRASIKTSIGDTPLDELMKDKFPTPKNNSVINEWTKNKRELYPFLMQLRLKNDFKEGEIITPERLQEIKKSGYNNHLFRYYDDAELSKILNTLASNKQQSPYEQYAAQGGYLYPDGGGINPGKQKAVASTTSVNTKLLPQEVIEDFNRYVSRIPLPPTKIIDKRVYNPVTKTKIKPTRDLLSGEYDTSVINNLVKYSKEYDVDPYLALAVGLQETQLGKTDSNIGHVMDLLNEDSNAERNLVSTLKDKMDYAKKLGYKDTKHLIQAYNGLGTITPETEKKYHGFKMKSIYGVPIPKEGINMSKTPLYGEKIQNIADSVLKQNPNIVNIVNTVKAQGGQINPYMYYAGGPIEYKVGGKVWQGIGSAAYGVLKGTLGTVTGGLTNPLMDMGEDALQKLANPNFDPNDPEDVKAMRQINTAGGAGEIGGAVLGGIVSGNVGSAVAQGASGVDDIIQSSTASDSTKQWSKGLSTIAQMGHMMNPAGATTTAGAGSGATEGASASTSNFKNIMTNFSGTEFGKSAGKAMPFVNQAAGMLGDKQGSLLEQGVARQDYLNSPEYLAMKDEQNQEYLNRNFNNFITPTSPNLNFAATGGDINNLVTLQNLYSMKNRYKDYKTKYQQGGNVQDKLKANGIVKIPSYVGYHFEHPDGGQPMGKKASVERDELVQLSGGGHAGMGTPEYVYPADVNNIANTKPEEGIYMPQMTSDYKMITDKYGMPRFTKKSPAKWLEEKLNRNSEFRVDVDGPTKESNDQAMAMAKGGREVSVSVNDLKQQAAQEDAMRIAMADNVAAYGGYLSKYRNLNMPKSKAKGGLTDPPDKWSLPIASRSNINQGSRNILNNNLVNTEFGSRIINEYDNGLPTDTSHIYMKNINRGGNPDTEYFFYNTGQNQPDGKPVMNYQGSNPNPNINDYLPKIKGLSRYAAGGPMVSNVQQPFEVAAQNRGGMLMDYANGGYVYQPMVQPMLAEGGNIHYDNGGYTGQLGKEHWTTTAAGLGQVIPDIAAGTMAISDLIKGRYKVQPEKISSQKFNVEPIAIGMKGETAENRALYKDYINRSGAPIGVGAAMLRANLLKTGKDLGKGLSDLYTAKEKFDISNQRDADLFNAESRFKAGQESRLAEDKLKQNLLSASQGVFGKTAGYLQKRQDAGWDQWRIQNMGEDYMWKNTSEGLKQVHFGSDGKYYDRYTKKEVKVIE
jgi:hypothetical protein